MLRHELGAELLPLSQLILSVQRTLRLRAARTAALWSSAALLAGLAGLLAMDAAFGLGRARLIVYGVAVAGGGVAVVAITLAAWRREPSVLYVARLIERRCPPLKDSLITFVELLGDGIADPSMIQAVGRRAAAALSRATTAEILPPLFDRRPLVSLAAAALLLGVSLWLCQGVILRSWTPSAEAGLASASARPGNTVAETSSDLQTPIENGLTLVAHPPSGVQDNHASAQLAQSSRRGDRGAAVPHSAGYQASSKAGANTGQGGASQAANWPGAIGPGTGGQGQGGTRPGGSLNTSTNGSVAGSDERGVAPNGSIAGAGGSQPLAGATGAGAVGAGGPGGAGGSTKPRQPYTGPPPLPARPQPTGFSPETLDLMRQVSRILQQEARPQTEQANGSVGRLPTGSADTGRFAAAWQKGTETTAPAATDAGQPPRVVAGALPGELVPPGLGPEARSTRGVTSAAPDGRHDLVQGDDAPISARLRPAVAAYFETVRRLAAERVAKDVSNDGTKRAAPGN